MKEKKGFTLIELLAVIVILAIIALIATPIVLSLIEKARKGAAEDSAYGIRKEAQLLYQTTLMDRAGSFNRIEADFSKKMTVNGKEYVETKFYATASSEGTTDKAIFEVDGTKPTNGKVTIHGDGKIDYEVLTINSYYCCIPAQGNVACEKTNSFDANCKYTGSGSSTTPSGGNTPTPTPGGDDTPTTGDDTPTTGDDTPTTGDDTSSSGGGIIGHIVYLNPKDLTVSCSIANSQIGLGTPNASGCMKFYIFGEVLDGNVDKYKLILDHNTTANVKFASTSTNNYAMNEARTSLESDTADWLGNPRLITADEVAEIIGTNSQDTLKWSSLKNYSSGVENELIDTDNYVDWFDFDGSGTTYSENDGWKHKSLTAQESSRYAWLYDYTAFNATHLCTSYGCNNATDVYTNGYWTSTTVTDISNFAWVIFYQGELYRVSKDTNNYGIRPVIEIDKNLVTVSNE